MVGGHQGAMAAVATGTIFQDPDLREFAVALPASAPRIQATARWPEGDGKSPIRTR